MPQKNAPPLPAADRSEEMIAKRYKKILHIYDDVLKINLYYVAAPNHATYAKILKEQLKINLPARTQEPAGMFTLYTKDNASREIGIIWTEKNNWPAIVHECLHAVYWMLSDQRDVALVAASEHIWCEYLEAIVRIIQKDSEKNSLKGIK